MRTTDHRSIGYAGKILAIALAGLLLSTSHTFGKPPKKGGGGGGGGGSTPSHQVVILGEQEGSVSGMNDAVGGVAELVGSMGGNCVYWQVDKNGGAATVTSRVLPPWKAGFRAVATDINNKGVIVGYEFIPGESAASPLVWRSGLAASPQLLPWPEIPADEPAEGDEPSEGANWEIVSVDASSISDDGLIVGNLSRINNDGWIAGRVYRVGGLDRLPAVIIR